jgi:hypothetical protein
VFLTAVSETMDVDDGGRPPGFATRGRLRCEEMHMGVTGWLGEAPDEVPPMPVTQMILGRQERRAGPLGWEVVKGCRSAWYSPRHELET